MRRLPIALLATSTLLACDGDVTGPSALADAASSGMMSGFGGETTTNVITVLGGDDDNFGFGFGATVPCMNFHNSVDAVDRGILDRTLGAAVTYPVDLTAAPDWAAGLVVDSAYVELREWSWNLRSVSVTVPGLTPWSIPRTALSGCTQPQVHRWRLDAAEAATLQGTGVVPVTIGFSQLSTFRGFAVDYLRITLFISDEAGSPDVEPVPPTADAGAHQVVECTGAGGTAVTLDGTGSFHDDGAIVQYEWLDADGEVIATGATPTVSVGHGSHTLTLRVTDTAGLSDEATVEVTVEDTTAPELALAVTPDEIWPPNGQHHVVTVNAAATDVCALEEELVLTGRVISSEVEGDESAGGTSGDIRVTRADGTVVVSSPSAPDVTFDPRTDQLEVRASRNGGNGRVYTITVVATDPSGNAADATATVLVPHNRGGENNGNGNDGARGTNGGTGGNGKGKGN